MLFGIFVLLCSGLCCCFATDEVVLKAITDLQDELANLKKIVASNTNTCESCCKNTSQKPQNSVDKHVMTRGIAVQGYVAFTAEISADIHTLGNRQTIIFDKVMVNIGNAYDHTDGVFVVPVSGLYAFYWHLMGTSTSENLDTTLMSTQGTLGYGFMQGKTGGNLATANLKAGSHVWVIKADNYGDDLHERFSTFSGFLLYEMEAENLVG